MMKVQSIGSIVPFALLSVAVLAAAGGHDQNAVNDVAYVEQGAAIGGTERFANELDGRTYQRAEQKLKDGIDSAIAIRIHTREDGRSYSLSGPAATLAEAASEASSGVAAKETAEVDDDASLTGKVMSAIEGATNLRGLDIRPEAESDGSVTLYGSVDTEDQKSQAEKLVATIDGVTRVESFLKVRRN